MRELKSGDKTALEIIYKLTYKKVYFFSLSITKDSEMTSDIVQEVYLSVFNSIGSLKDEKLFIAWLNRITYNATMKELAKSKKRPINIPDEELQVKLVDENNPMIRCIENESTKELMKCILGLKEKYRTVLILKYFNNYKIQEMAELLNCPEGTVKSRLNTAKEALKNELNKNNNKVIVSLFFSMMLSSALTKSAEAAVSEENNTNNKSSSNKGVLTLVNASIISIASASIILVGSFIDMNNEAKVSEKTIEEEYNDSITNDAVEVRISVGNIDNKDSIKVFSSSNEEVELKKISNEVFSFIAKANGNYRVQVQDAKNNEETIKEITIDNIDKEAPGVKSSSENDNTLDIVLSDNLSGIDYFKLELTLEDGTAVALSSIDEDNSTISMELNQGVFFLKIYDNVGNYSIQKIEVE